MNVSLVLGFLNAQTHIHKNLYLLISYSTTDVGIKKDNQGTTTTTTWNVSLAVQTLKCREDK